MRRELSFAFVALAGVVSPARAQVEDPNPSRSLGQPPLWKPYLGGFVGASPLTGTATVSGLALAGVFRDFAPPEVGIGVSAELYAGALQGRFDGGARALLSAPVFYLHAGADYAAGAGNVRFLLGLNAPLRRGGPLGAGTRVRLDWLPGRGQTLELGVVLPLGQGPMGQTRPPTHKAAVPKGRPIQSQPVGAVAADWARRLAEMDRAQRWVLAGFSLLYRGKGETHAAALATQRGLIARFLDSAGVTDGLRPRGRSFEGELAVWHVQMAEALGLAAGASPSGALAEGRPLASMVRRALLSDVLIPYDAMFGQHRDPGHLFGFGAQARRGLEAALPAELSREARTRILDTFDRIVVMLDAHRAARVALEDGDGRYGWVPLQLALLPDEYDGQTELNSLIGRIAGRPFASGNRLGYVAGGQFRATVRQQLAAARRYHVLWVHDFPGLAGDARPDTVAFQTTLAYLEALTAAVRDYDSRGGLPKYYVFLDQHYYDARRSRLWMSLLENPLGRSITLPAGSEGMQAALRSQVESLRAAVAASAGLQAGARRHGQGWLTSVVRVHVNITHPADLSFTSRHLVLGAPFVTDNVARDHRKLAFMDLTPDDPAAGSAVLAGVGVGENYADPTWDDRSLVIAGPAALPLVGELRRLLQRHGFRADEIPAELRTLEIPRTAVAQADQTGAGVMIATNDVGFGKKHASAVQMALITLMPAGSLIYIPDSIWTSSIYGAELVVAALRGCKVRLIAPALSNAPSAAAPTMARTWDLFTRLLEIELGLQRKLRDRQGDLRVGFYQRHAPLDDPAGLLREMAEGLERSPWLAVELDLRGASAHLRRKADSLEASPLAMGKAIGDTLRRLPRLHAKTQLFLTGPAWRGLLQEQRLGPLLQHEFLPTVGLLLPMDRVGMPQGSDQLMAQAASAISGLSPDSTALFLTVGSQNKDLRSMLLDGEIKATIAGGKALIGLLEFAHLAALSQFPESQQELERLMPPWSERTRSLAYKIRRAL